jgi:hypothetical protein
MHHLHKICLFNGLVHAIVLKIQNGYFHGSEQLMKVQDCLRDHVPIRCTGLTLVMGQTLLHSLSIRSKVDNVKSTRVSTPSSLSTPSSYYTLDHPLKTNCIGHLAEGIFAKINPSSSTSSVMKKQQIKHLKQLILKSLCGAVVRHIRSAKKSASSPTQLYYKKIKYSA